jgi:hypothetical protein
VETVPLKSRSVQVAGLFVAAWSVEQRTGSSGTGPAVGACRWVVAARPLQRGLARALADGGRVVSQSCALPTCAGCRKDAAARASHLEVVAC